MRLLTKTCWIYASFYSASAHTLQGMLLGRLVVGLGMGLGPPVASLYVTEVCMTVAVQL